MQFSSSITTHADDEAETPLRVEYDYEDGRVEITSVVPPMAFDTDATMLRCAEHAAETLMLRADHDAARREDAGDAARELARERGAS